VPNPSLPAQESWKGAAPLRQLSIAEVLDCALRLYRANFRTFASAVASVLVTMSILWALYSRDTPGGVDWQQQPAVIPTLMRYVPTHASSR